MSLTAGTPITASASTLIAVASASQIGASPPSSGSRHLQRQTHVSRRLQDHDEERFPTIPMWSRWSFSHSPQPTNRPEGLHTRIAIIYHCDGIDRKSRLSIRAKSTREVSMPLTAKQQVFVREYLIDMSPADAYLRAGYRVASR